jgi:hypothetical protein
MNSTALRRSSGVLDCQYSISPAISKPSETEKTVASNFISSIDSISLSDEILINRMFKIKEKMSQSTAFRI